MCGFFKNDLSRCTLEHEKVIQLWKIILRTEPCEFPVSDAIPIENGKNTGRGCKPHSCPTSAEASPSQNNPSSAVKATEGLSEGHVGKAAESLELSCQLG